MAKSKSITSGDYTLIAGASISPYDRSRFVATVMVTKAVSGQLPQTSKHMASVQAHTTPGFARAHAAGMLTNPDQVKKLIDKHNARYDTTGEQKESD